jgi:hypothetical protein
MSNITILNQDLPDFLQNAGVSELTRQIAGKGGVKRIVPKNGIFRKMVGGEEMGKVKGSINVVIVNASPKVGRIFYAKQWTPDAEPTSPDCFSNDGNAPDAGSASPQSDRCDTCPQNVKGSGMANSKACRYSRRLAVMLEENFNTALENEVYQMNLASKSLFGDSPSDKTHMFENYSKYLANNGKSLDYVVTEISFNEDNDNQSVMFTATRFINKAEHTITSKHSALPETKKMVTMTPYQADVSGRNQSAAPALSAPKGKAVEDAVEVEPKKRETKKAETPVPTAKAALDSVVKAWTDEE